MCVVVQIKIMHLTSKIITPSLIVTQ